MLGIVSYETFVADGRINFYGANDYMLNVPVKFEKQEIANQLNVEYFKSELKAHQQGKTDFVTFIKMRIETGVEKWKRSIHEITCTYFDKRDREVLVEKFPG